MPIRRSDILRLADVGLRGYGLYHGVKGAQKAQKLAEAKEARQAAIDKIRWGTPGFESIAEKRTSMGIPKAGLNISESGGMAVPGLEHERLNIAKDYLGLSQKRADIEEKRFLREGIEKGVSMMPFTGTTVIRQQKSIENYESKGVAKGLEKAFEVIKGYGEDENIPTRLAAYQKISSPTVKNMLYKVGLEGLEKEYGKALELDPEGTGNEAIAIKRRIDMIKENKGQGLIDNMFPGVVAEIETEQSKTTGKSIKSWITPENKVINIPNNVAPPEGSVPYKTGIQFESTPEGGVSFTTTALPGQKGTLTPSIKTKAQQGILDTSAGIQRLDEIAGSLKPEFLELGTKWDNFKTRWKEKLSIPTSGAEREQLEDFASFRRDAIDNINRYIKEITGAQMSEREADRLRKATPDPGEGLLDGDSPTEFISKWKSAMKSLKLSQARYTYLLKNGMSDSAIKGMAKNDTLPGINKIEEIIKKRNKELESQIKKSNPNMSKADINQQIMQILRQEFGL